MFDNMWLVLPGSKALVSPYALYPESKPIEAAQPFTVSMVSVVVAEDLDGFLRGNNDILVLTKTSLGEQPFVERIHFYQDEVPKGQPIRNMLADNMYVADDYSGSDRFWLELNVLEIDTDTGERKAAMNAFRSLAATAGAVFPAIVPYAFSASAVAGVINKLVSVLEKDTHVVKVPFSLYPGNPRPGKAPFQVGTYVAFAHPQDPSRFTLQANGLLTIGDDQPSDVSYAVFDVSAVKQVDLAFVLNQKVATLMTQIQKGNANNAKGTLDFLSSTLAQYSNFQKLNRYLDLSKKQHPSEQEQAMLADIA